MAVNEQDLLDGLIARGLSPLHAAVIVGNMRQESGLNPSALNAGEGANGLLQWRLDRWDGLRNFAASRGAQPNDPNAQLDYVMHELQGPERRAAGPFLAAQDLPTANRALKGYIRYGDDSEGTRLANAQRLSGSGQSGTPPAAVPFSVPENSQQTTSSDSGTVADVFGQMASFSPPAPQRQRATAGGGEGVLTAYLDDVSQDRLFAPRTTSRAKLRRR